MEYFSKKKCKMEFNQRLLIAMMVADPTHHMRPNSSDIAFG